jgi:hypothetical protein
MSCPYIVMFCGAGARRHDGLQIRHVECCD